MTKDADTLSFLYGGNAVHLAELYARYLEDPNAVDSSWIPFFSDLHDQAPLLARDFHGTEHAPRDTRILGAGETAARAAGAAPAEDAGAAAARDSMRALMMIRAYRARGHLAADLDPLGLAVRAQPVELDYRTYGFTESDLDHPILLDGVLGLDRATLTEILSILKATYCGKIGVEFMHIQDPARRNWIQQRVEAGGNRTDFTDIGKRAILASLTEAEGFERFLQVKYTGTKRFGLEGGESLIPALEQLVKRGGQLGIAELCLGMAHRGRLNVLANFMEKPYQAIFSEFQGNPANPSDVQGSGDVKYHLGTSGNRTFDGITVHLSLSANPSHLEVVDPVVVGKVRAKQDQEPEDGRRRVMGVLVHGDAAFAGQGVVSETFLLSRLEGFGTGGTLHFIVNNQIGFTTLPKYSRSGPYPSDVAKGGQVPVFHVNGDDPEAVVHVARMAVEYRQEFAEDVVIDMFCYRRHGHNESDEPAFTQPLMYRKIAGHPTTRTIYARKLVAEGTVTEDEANAMLTEFQTRMEGEFAAAPGYKVNKADWLEGRWHSYVQLAEEEEYREDRTGLAVESLAAIGMALTEVPPHFNVNRKVVRLLQARREMMETGDGIDWGAAEALALGSLLAEGRRVRLSGQDVGRGTFSHRHSVLVDQDTEDHYIPLNHVREGQARFEVVDSPLSEEAVLGFEYGFSMAEPEGLTIWEGQFGDFANGAQVIIDQFIGSAESKWLRMSGLVLLLPHGQEGQGPEHSSARLERFLQLSAEDNWSVCNLTTPANYFHALRRQLLRNFRKPLVIMAPKSLLRHKLAVSKLTDMGAGSHFHRVLPETDRLVADARIRRVILCAGKVYYDLVEERRRRSIDDVAVIRVEQLYPWPKDTLKHQLARYPKADLLWVQEEPANMGAWMFVDRRIEYICAEIGAEVGRARYCGRRAAAAPATGLFKTHAAEQAWICEMALTGAAAELPQPFQRATPLARLTA